MYSIGMTIYEVSFLRYKSGRSVEAALGFDGQNPVLRAQRLLTILNILDGVRPKAPIFVATRGYTKELWEVTTSCWKEDPSERPTVDHVLAALRSAAEQWKPRHGELVTLPPQDNWSPTLTEKSDPPTIPEYENEPVTVTTSALLTSLQPPVVETPIPAPAPLAPIPTPPVPT